jgi:hypothetical protein
MSLTLPEPAARIGVETAQHTALANQAMQEIEQAGAIFARSQASIEEVRDSVRTIATMNLLMTDLGWPDAPSSGIEVGGTIPLLQLRSWVERWREDAKARLADVERNLEVTRLRQEEAGEDPADQTKLRNAEIADRIDIADAQRGLVIWLEIEGRIDAAREAAR